MDAIRSAPSPRRKLTFAERLDAYERLMRLDKPIGTLLLLWPTLSALWFAADGAPRLSLVLDLLRGHAGDALGGLCAERLGRSRFRCARRAHGTAPARRRRHRAVGSAGASPRVGALAALLLVALDESRDDAVVVAGAGDRDRLSVLQAFLRRAAGISRHRVLVRDPDGVCGGARRRAAGSRGCCSRLNLFWVIAYDTEYAMVDRADDVKIGIRTSALTFGRYDVAAVALCYARVPRRHGVDRPRPTHCTPSISSALVVALALRGSSRVDHPPPRPGRLLPRIPRQSLARPRACSRVSRSTMD